MGLALVTGTSSGIGAAYADRLARRGHDLIMVARRRGPMEDLATRLRRESGVDVEVLQADLADPADLRRVEDRLAGETKLTMLVNNAAMGGIGPLTGMDREDIARMIAVNVLAVTQLTRAALPVLVEQKGTLVNVASGAAFACVKGAAVYSATKAFVVQFTRTLHAEIGESVRLQALIPGLTRTNLGDAEKTGFFDQFPPEWVMSPEDLVDASLAGLELRELVCVPAFDDLDEFERASATIQKLGMSTSRREPASRYRSARSR
jgi:short-subunit dehydrogenase